ncbi:MAG: GIY-YIG nuclease family protein [bacterium]|nr:GIY-YIG nuclease family protein [bacterium]
MFSFLPKKRVGDLPLGPGVYRFDDKKSRPLYIGKALNLRERVKSHFQQRNWRDGFFIGQVKRVGSKSTASEIEALILEASLIKKYQPKYNVVWKDDKNYFFVGLTREKLPRVLLTHQTKPEVDYLGPFVDSRALKITLRLLRQVFPHYAKKTHPKNLCPDCHLGLCPGPNPNSKEYRRNIKNLKTILRGKGAKLLKNLKKEMMAAAKIQNFEKAARERDQIRALEKIFAHRQNLSGSEELQRILKMKKPILRLEAYDISNLQGQQATGSMVVFTKGLPDRNQYRKFKIKTSGKPNDVAMIKEILQRRFNHPEWQYPDLILIDGGKAQLNAAIFVLNQRLSISVLALAKRHNELFLENRKKPLLLKSLPRPVFNLILQLRDEAHRFARRYHFYLRRKKLLS